MPTNQPPPSEGNAVIAGARDGKSYLLDSSLIISGSLPGLITQAAAAEPPALVVGCGAETALSQNGKLLK